MTQPLEILVIESDEDEVFLIREALRRSECDCALTVAGDLATAQQEVVKLYDAILLGRLFEGVDPCSLLGDTVSAPVVVLNTEHAQTHPGMLSKSRVFEIAVRREFQIFPEILSRAVLQSIERSRRRKALLQEQEKRALVLESSRDGVWEWDLESGGFYANEKFNALLQVKDGKSQQAWQGLLMPSQGFHAGLQDLLAGSTTHWETVLLAPTTPPRWVSIRAAALLDEEGSPVRVAGSLSDVHAEHEAKSRIHHAATHDLLTGLPNRTYLQQEVQRLQEQEGEFSVLYLDLDWFKGFNDTLGHRVGDAILVEVSQRLTRAIGEHGFLARHGGDEFVALLGEKPELTAQKCLHAIRKDLDLHLGRYQITASAGLARPDGARERDLIADADLAMFEAKRQGRDRLVVFEGEYRSRAERRFTLDRDLREALSKRALSVVYQPIVSLGTGKPVALEALCRWDHPTLGPVPPAEFIPLAEKAGLVGILGDFVFCRAVEDILEYPLLAKHSSVSVNVSAEQLADKHFLARIQGFINDIPPGSLGIEITESGVIRNAEHVVELLNQLREKRVYAHLDDFGTGYASLKHLVTLPLEGVKIDMSLTKDVLVNSRVAAAIRATVGLSHSLGMYCVAEGVSSEVQKKKLEALGVDFAQGFYLAKPMKAAEAQQWVRQRAGS